MVRIFGIMPWFHGPSHICRHHFYKILILFICLLMGAQYALNVFFYQSSTYFFFNASSFSSFYSNPTAPPNLHTHVQNRLAKVTTAIVTLNQTKGDLIVAKTGLPQTTLKPVVISLAYDKSHVKIATNNVSVLNSSHVRGNLTKNMTAHLTTKLPAIPTKKTVLSTAKAIAEKNKTLSTTVAPARNTTNSTALPLCPLVPPKLVGPVKVLTDAPSFEELEKLHPELALGGRYWPKDCQARYKVAIIIPYRDRELHLRLFLHNLHPILQRQQLDYGIYVIEQAGKTKFNRAMLMNVGFIESLKQYDYQCFIFHDVDLLPEDDRNIYSCPEQPRHLSVAIDVFNYRLPYNSIFGGVSALTIEQMKKINGFSNSFWGWGGEDDDMSNRINSAGYHIIRYPNNIARYKMMKHKKDDPNPERYKVLYQGKKRYSTDGLNSLKYKRVDILLKRLYTWVYVELKK